MIKKLMRDFIFVKLDEQEKVTSAGIVLPNNVSGDDTVKGTILQVGEEWVDDRGVVHTPELAAGQRILLRSGQRVPHEDGFIVHPNEVVAVIE